MILLGFRVLHEEGVTGLRTLAVNKLDGYYSITDTISKKSDKKIWEASKDEIYTVRSCNLILIEFSFHVTTVTGNYVLVVYEKTTLYRGIFSLEKSHQNGCSKMSFLLQIY
jgi:hypothetical protein